MASVFGSDAYSYGQIAERVEREGVEKARLPFLATLTLGVIAGGFIGLGCIFYTLVTSDSELSFAVSRFLGGFAFSLGYILAVIAGAEVFTGNNLLVMGWASRKITLRQLLSNWAIVFFANAIGAWGLIAVVYYSDFASMNGGLVGLNAIEIAAGKVSLPFWEAFFKGVLANLLICLAMWLSMAGRSVIDRFFAVAFPITSFMAMGFEQSTSNMFFIPYGVLLHSVLVEAGGALEGVAAAWDAASLTWTGFVRNMIPVTLGNIVGGSGMVAGVYYLVYRKELAAHALDDEGAGKSEIPSPDVTGAKKKGQTL